MISRFWYTASAVPEYQEVSIRCCAGNSSTNSPKSPRRKLQPFWICRINECALYCVRTPIRRMPELMQLDNGKSIMRNFPPKGTAGLARHSVRSLSREPRPPARINANVRRVKRLTKRVLSAMVITSTSSTLIYVLFPDPEDTRTRQGNILVLEDNSGTLPDHASIMPILFMKTRVPL